MRSRSARNIIDAILVAALVVVCLVAVNLHGDSADKSRAVREASQTVSSLATESQANFGRANRLQQSLNQSTAQREANEKGLIAAEHKIADLADKITVAIKGGASPESIMNLRFNYATSIAAWFPYTLSTIPPEATGDVSSDGFHYLLVNGIYDGVPVVYVNRLTQ